MTSCGCLQGFFYHEIFQSFCLSAARLTFSNKQAASRLLFALNFIPPCLGLPSLVFQPSPSNSMIFSLTLRQCHCSLMQRASLVALLFFLIGLVYLIRQSRLSECASKAGSPRAHWRKEEWVCGLLSLSLFVFVLV